MSEFIKRFPKPKNLSDSVALAIWEERRTGWVEALKWVQQKGQVKCFEDSETYRQVINHEIIKQELNMVENE